MLTLFENITEDITDLEKSRLVPMLLSTLSTSHEANRMTSRNLCRWFNASGEIVTDVRIRKMVAYIRCMNIASPKVLIGTSTGYFLTGDIQVIDDQIESLQGRVNMINAVIDSLQAQRQNLKR